MNTYTIGQEVAISQDTRDPDYRHLFGKVIKISPTGQITVKTTVGALPMRFNPNGRRIGGIRLAFLHADVEAYKALAEDLKREVGYR